MALGQEIKCDVFAAGDHIDATAVSKGKGFQGAIKRHGQSRGPMAHGSKYHRHAGSNGACSDPSKVFKGKHMPGHMGHVQVTVQNLEIVRVDTENNLLLVKGAVPGPKKSLVTIKETVKKNGAMVSGPVPLPTKKEVVTILRAVHKYKDSREQFEQRTHKRLIDILTPTQKTVDALSRLEMPAGVHIDIKMKNR